MTNGSKKLKSLFMGWHNPPWKNLTNMVSGIVWPTQETQCMEWCPRKMDLQRRMHQSKVWPTQEGKIQGCPKFSRQQTPLALETNATINSMHLTNISPTWCTSYNSRLAWNDPVYYCRFHHHQIPDFFEFPLQKHLPAKDPRSHCFHKAFWRFNSMWLKSKSTAKYSWCHSKFTLWIGWIWSDHTNPQCICCTTKACAPWIDECNWLELVVQSCR